MNKIILLSPQSSQCQINLSLNHKTSIVGNVDLTSPHSDAITALRRQKDKDDNVHRWIVECDRLLKDLVLGILKVIECQPVECRLVWVGGQNEIGIDKECTSFTRLKKFVELNVC